MYVDPDGLSPTGVGFGDGDDYLVAGIFNATAFSTVNVIV